MSCPSHSSVQFDPLISRQTNSPANKVTAALASANKSKALARRLFYSFRAPGKADVELEDIARFFPDLETAETAFTFFDKDNNGNATRDEIESAVLMLHRDRLALEASMRDLDGAVRHLDGIFMVLVLLIWVLVIAAMITTRLTAFVTSAGTFVLGLSWLIGTTLQEIILSCKSSIESCCSSLTDRHLPVRQAPL